jgi:hypothetical protein
MCFVGGEPTKHSDGAVSQTRGKYKWTQHLRENQPFAVMRDFATFCMHGVAIRSRFFDGTRPTAIL